MMSDAEKAGEGFQDPLQNYEPKTYDDPLEEAIAEGHVSQIQHVPHATIDVHASTAAAIQKLASQHVACLLVEEKGKLVGVFSDRDVLTKVALEEGQLERPVSEVMTADPVYVYETDPIASALCVMAVSGYRHVPIVNVQERIVGIVSPQRVTAFLSKYFRD
jgi:predicted transcriptional regulator